MKKRNKAIATLALGVMMTQSFGFIDSVKVYADNEVSITSPEANYKVPEDYIVRFSIPTTIKPSNIEISFTKEDGTLAKQEVAIKEDGKYSELINGLKIGENVIKVTAKVEDKSFSSEVNVNVLKAVTDITWDEENKGPFASDKNQFKNLLKKRNTSTALEQGKLPKSDAFINYFIDTLFNEAISERIRPDVVFAQIMLETGWLTYTGDVNETQYNYGGIGATGDGAMGNAFSNVEEGIRVNVQHLFAYATEGTLKNPVVDPRYALLDGKRGKTPKVEYLGFYENTNSMGWAMGTQYGYKILDVINEILRSSKTQFKVVATKSKISNMEIYYVNMDGISTTINQGDAGVGSDARVAVTSNDLTKQKFKITNVKTKEVIDSGYIKDYEYIFKIKNAGEYKVEVSIVPLNSSSTTPSDTITKTFVVEERIDTNSSNTSNTSNAGKNTTTASSTTPTNKTNSVNPSVGSEYYVFSKLNTYANAGDAANLKNAVKQYEVGTYYVYKVYDGMINITKKKGVAGAWINPKENVKSTTNPTTTTTKTTTATTTAKTIAQTTTPKTTPKTTTANVTTPTVTNSGNYVVGGKYVVNGSVDKYSNANDAKNKLNKIGTYTTGTYYIYKIFDGMINISKTPGIAGAWINPASSVSTTTPKTTTASTNYVVNGTVKISNTIDTFDNASDALNHRNKKSTLAPGTYYIYKIFTGMLNVSSKKGIAGAWINPKDIKVTTLTTNQVFTTGISISPALVELNITSATTNANTTTNTITSSTTNGTNTLTANSSIELVKDLNVYETANDAQNKSNSSRTYTKGTYVVYKEYNGMLNISKTPGIPGAWINPSENQ